jgi:cell division protein ZapA
MKEEISINVTIADVVYPLTVLMEDEENVRKAARMINEEVRQYRDEFGISDKGNILSMIALKFASELLHSRDQKTVEDNSITQNLHKLNETLEQHLKATA